MVLGEDVSKVRCQDGADYTDSYRSQQERSICGLLAKLGPAAGEMSTMSGARN
jgi:hypothetical protein